MGVSSNPLLVSLNLNKMIRGNRVVEAQSQSKRKCGSKIRPRKVLIKRSKVLEGSRSPENAIEKKVRTLKKLVPNGTSDESMGLDGLFIKTVDYILSLQMRVELMQTMVRELSTASDD